MSDAKTLATVEEEADPKPEQPRRKFGKDNPAQGKDPSLGLRLRAKRAMALISIQSFRRPGPITRKCAPPGAVFRFMIHSRPMEHH